jgi:HEAT repeat protein
MHKISLILAVLVGLSADGTLAQAQDEIREIGGKTLKQWIAEISHPDPGVRENAIHAVVYFGKDAREAGKALIRELNDYDPSLRVNAAIAIGLIGLEVSDLEAGVKALGRLLANDSQAIVRLQAAVALGNIGPDAEAALPQITGAIRDTYNSWEVRRIATAALRSVAYNSKKGPDGRALKALLGALNDSCTQVRMEALRSIIALGPPWVPKNNTQPPDEVQRQNETLRQTMKTALDRHSKSPDKIQSIWALVALMRVDKITEKHLLTISYLIKSPDLSVRVNAANALEAIGEGAASRVSDLIAALNDKEVGMVVAAASALGAMGEAAQKAVPALTMLAEDKNDATKLTAKLALEKITKAPKPAEKKQPVEKK